MWRLFKFADIPIDLNKKKLSRGSTKFAKRFSQWSQYSTDHENCLETKIAFFGQCWKTWKYYSIKKIRKNPMIVFEQKKIMHFSYSVEYWSYYCEKLFVGMLVFWILFLNLNQLPSAKKKRIKKWESQKKFLVPSHFVMALVGFRYSAKRQGFVAIYGKVEWFCLIWGKLGY